MCGVLFHSSVDFVELNRYLLWSTLIAKVYFFVTNTIPFELYLTCKLGWAGEIIYGSHTTRILLHRLNSSPPVIGLASKMHRGCFVEWISGISILLEARTVSAMCLVLFFGAERIAKLAAARTTTSSAMCAELRASFPSCCSTERPSRCGLHWRHFCEPTRPSTPTRKLFNASWRKFCDCIAVVHICNAAAQHPAAALAVVALSPTEAATPI